MRETLHSFLYNIFSRETKEGIKVVPFALALPGTKGPTLDPEKVAKLGAVLPFAVGKRQLFIFVGNLRSPSGSFVDPLLPLGPLLQGGELDLWPVHRTFLIDEDPDKIKEHLGLSGKEQLPIEVIHDLPFERYQEEYLEDSETKGHLVSTEGAFLAQEDMIKDMDPLAYKAATLSIEWTGSGIMNVVGLLWNASLGQDQGTDQIPVHVRDSLVGLLSTDTPEDFGAIEFDAYIEKLVTDKKTWVYDAVAGSVVEIQNQVTGLADKNGRPNPFTVHARTRQMCYTIENSILSASEVRFQELCDRFSQGQPSEPSDDISPSLESRFFPKFRLQVSQLGESLTPYIRNRRWEFFSSCGWGAAATGLLLNYSIDPTIALSIFALIAAVSLKRFRSEVGTLWGTYENQLSRMSRDFMEDLQAFFIGQTGPNREKDLKRYKMDMEETILLRKELHEARELLLKLAPSLRSEFPEWGSPSSSPKETQG
ncbi:hypothetical protein TWF506_006857 [Arthrobotrys conoides]